MILDVSEEERLNIFDIDSEGGIFGLSEYAVEIFEHLRKAEVTTLKLISNAYKSDCRFTCTTFFYVNLLFCRCNNRNN